MSLQRIFSELQTRGGIYRINPLYTGGLLQVVICWMSPFVILGVSGLFYLFFFYFLMENPVSKQCRPRVLNKRQFLMIIFLISHLNHML